jgi:hypothetical protein
MTAFLKFPGAPFSAGSDSVEFEVSDGILPEGWKAVAICDSDPDLSWFDDFPQRAADFEAGRFVFVGVIVTRPACPCGRFNESSGVWGIESDSDFEYIEEIVREQVEELKH